ncbi:response regulator [Luteimonas cucumeris]|uniref:response regulator n=1 Tax=Luteimonas cucumeris TaxID=985012 RepID=UPI001315425D|nr:response regulator [Luteimonas cucumeris]
MLLVEDDPTTRAFLAAAAEAYPAEVDAADSVTTALVLATRHRYALWLFDARLPDGSGTDLLVRLRQHDVATPALAHTASQDNSDHAALLQAGFLATLVKPLNAGQLHEAIARALGGTTGSTTHDAFHSSLLLWDDAIALRAMNGNREHVASLRTLFVTELPVQRDAILAALEHGGHQAARNLLHRLKASCGFVGASRLAATVGRLDADIDQPGGISMFADIVEQTLSSNPG